MFLKKGPNADDSLPYSSAGPLFTPAERSFLGVLDSVIGDDHRVFGKVRLSDLIVPEKGLSTGARRTALNKIQRKHLDFVICRRSDTAVVAAVELDDQSHREAKCGERDAFVEQALAKAGVALLRFPAKKAYVLAEVQEKLAAVLPGSAVVQAAPVRLATAAAVAKEPAETAAPPTAAEAAPICPACNSPMVKRQAKQGPNAGKWFWACSVFPKCRRVVEVGVIYARAYTGVTGS